MSSDDDDMLVRSGSLNPGYYINCEFCGARLLVDEEDPNTVYQCGSCGHTINMFEEDGFDDVDDDGY